MTPTKHNRTAEELRDFIIAALTAREATCRNAAMRAGRSAKGQSWEHGRADAYKDFREFLLKLDLAAPSLSGERS